MEGEHKSIHRVTEGFRVNAKIRRQLKARKQRIQKRLDKTKLGSACPVLSASNIHYELADRTRAISAGRMPEHRWLCPGWSCGDLMNRFAASELTLLRNHCILPNTRLFT